jgi:hypothetical protein
VRGTTHPKSYLLWDANKNEVVAETSLVGMKGLPKGVFAILAHDRLPGCLPLDATLDTSEQFFPYLRSMTVPYGEDEALTPLQDAMVNACIAAPTDEGMAINPEFPELTKARKLKATSALLVS